MLGAGTNAMATDNPISCPTVTLSGILSNRILDKDTTYLLSGCVSVPSGVTITAQAGVVIMGEKSSNGTLVFRKGSTFTSQGTSSLPVIFTSNQIQANRNPGDWGGIIFEGDAPNNNSNSISLSNRTCNPVSGGGSNASDNSGTLKYMRIELAEYGLTLISVGSGTEMHDIQIVYSSQDGLQLLGGTVNFKRLAFFNNYGSDILATQGNQSKAQGIVSLRVDNSAHLASTDVSSIVIKNNDNAPAYASASFSNTHPIFSNVTLIGPKYCVGSPDAEFKYGILMLNNAEGEIYNSYIDGWRYGFYLDGSQVLANANASSGATIQFAYNSLNNNITADYGNSGTWPSGCATSMTQWLSGTGLACRQRGIEIGNAAAYSSLCTSSPSFGLSSSGIDDPDFDDVPVLANDEFFVATDNRGAFDATAWTTSWTNWATLQEDFCPVNKKMAPTGIANIANNANSIALAPNPADGMTYAMFTTAQSGSVQITVTNSVGQVVRTITQDLGKGNQRIAIPTSGLSAGMYMVNVALQQGSIARTKLIVK